MIRIEYDPMLIEKAVFLSARREAHRERELHSKIDPIYETTGDEQRRRAFLRVFRDHFTQFGLDRLVPDLIAEHPLIGERVARCIVRQARRAKTQSAELFIPQSTIHNPRSTMGPTLVIEACPESLLDAGDAKVRPFVSRMRRELLHVADMLDDRFAYDREAITGLSARDNLVRDRYRVLWDIYVEGRLNRANVNGDDARGVKQLELLFHRVFAGPDAHPCENEAFNRVFRAPALTSRLLLDWARHPEGLFDQNKEPGDSTPPGVRDSSTSANSNPPDSAPPAARAHANSPGARCPLCGFSTHDWFDFGDRAGAGATGTIKRDRPDWSPDDGACRQCAELYVTIAAHDDPSTCGPTPARD